MDKKAFLSYFKSKKKIEETRDVQLTGIFKPATSNVYRAELAFAEQEEERSISKKQRYQKSIPEKIKIEVGRYAKDFGTQSAIKKFSAKYPQHVFNRTSVNYWKGKSGKVASFKRAGRPNTLSDDLLRKVKDIAIGTRMAGGVVNRRQLINIGKGVLRANDPHLLKEFGGHVDLSKDWAKRIFKKLNWKKRKATTGKVDPSPQFLAEEKFTFQRQIASVVYEHDIPPELVINLDQTPLSYVSPGKYTFSFKGAKNVPVKGVDDKRQITATFAVSSTGDFLPIQLIYEGKTKRCLPKIDFPEMFNVTFSENHWSNTEKSIEYFEETIFPYLSKIKREKGYPEEQMSLAIMDSFKGQDNDILKELCEENYCKTKIVPHNLTNKFQPLDVSVNKPSKAFITNKYNDWFSKQVADQLEKGVQPTEIKITTKLTDIKPLHAQWVIDLYHHLCREKELVVNGFEATGVTEAITKANEVMIRIENPFKE